MCLQALSKLADPAAHEEAERTVKKRTLGNMRLISELYKLDMVKDWIMTACLEDLLTATKGKVPPEHNIEVIIGLARRTRHERGTAWRGCGRRAAQPGVAVGREGG